MTTNMLARHRRRWSAFALFLALSLCGCDDTHRRPDNETAAVVVRVRLGPTIVEAPVGEIGMIYAAKAGEPPQFDTMDEDVGFRESVRLAERARTNGAPIDAGMIRLVPEGSMEIPDFCSTVQASWRCRARRLGTERLPSFIELASTEYLKAFDPSDPALRGTMLMLLDRLRPIGERPKVACEPIQDRKSVV